MSWFNITVHVMVQCLFFFKKFLEDISPFAGPLIPLFWTSGNFSWFQSQSGQSYSCLAEAYVLHRQGCVQYFPGDGGSGVRSSMAGKKRQTYMLRIFCLDALGTCWEGSGWWWWGGGCRCKQLPGNFLQKLFLYDVRIVELQQQIAVIKRGGCRNSIALDLQLKKHYSRYDQHKKNDVVDVTSTLLSRDVVK